MSARTPPPSDGVRRLVGARVASRIGTGHSAPDAALWPRAARPGWVEAARAARPLVGEIEGLRDQFRLAGQVRVVLAAAGGVGVAAEALCTTGGTTEGGTMEGGGAGLRLVVLDSTDPVQVADALAGDLAATVLVVSAPPGEDTAGVELLHEVVHRAFRAEGLDPTAHTVVVTPPDGPLQQRAGGAVTVLGPADVDGPWAALTAFALVPAGLAGADVGAVLADAAEAQPALAADADDNPALRLGVLLAAASGDGRPAESAEWAGGVVALAGADNPALAEWAAQLVGAGLGKDGHGPLAVLVEGPAAPEWSGGAALALGVGGVPGAVATTTGPPAAQILHWQYAVAVAAHLLGVDPTDRPDAAVPATGPATGAAARTEHAPAFTDGGIDVHAGPWLPAGTSTVTDALRALSDSPGTHLAMYAYLDRGDDASAAVLRPELARRTGLPTLFGWAPRCLPGGGQRDKGGAPGALVCQLTAGPDPAPVPGAESGIGAGTGPVTDRLSAHQLAQARTDAAALARRGTTVLRLHFTDRVAGLVTLARAVQQL